jgi:predicted nuclease with RNAse H fold
VRSLGIDVGAERKGLDAVVLDEGLTPTHLHQHLDVDGVQVLIREAEPDVIAIDSPPTWRKGVRRRATEHELMARGIRLYQTPDETPWRNHRFYRWMQVGATVFQVAADEGFPLATRPPVDHRAIEVFPHASAVALAGCLAPKRADKALWRAWVLQEQGLHVLGTLWSSDQIDAALAALTGLRALQGACCFPGSSDEGAIVVPTVALAERYVSVR